MASFAYPDQLPVMASVCSTFVLDCGAFTAWKRGGEVDYLGYCDWVRQWHRHPAFRWAIIPDVIDGTERENDLLINRWPLGTDGVPVWHLHEDINRLLVLAARFPTVALGSSGQIRNAGKRIMVGAYG